MATETYGFKNWEELRDKARDELEEELMAEMIFELERSILRSMHDQFGDLTDAFNIPEYDAEHIQAEIMGAVFDRLMWSVEYDSDHSERIEAELEKLQSYSEAESDLRQAIQEQRD